MGTVRRWTRSQTATWSTSQVVAMSSEAMASEGVSTWSTEEIAQQHDGYWTIHDLMTGIFGSGADLESANEDFQRALREHLDVLTRQEALSPELSEQLEHLRRRLS